MNNCIKCRGRIQIFIEVGDVHGWNISDQNIESIKWRFIGNHKDIVDAHLSTHSVIGKCRYKWGALGWQEVCEREGLVARVPLIRALHLYPGVEKGFLWQNF